MLFRSCNTYLVKTLRQALNPTVRRTSTHRGITNKNGHRITLSLAAIIFAFIFLVIPGEVVFFLKDPLLRFREGNFDTNRYNLALAVTQTTQALNFSFNFVIYCTLNTHFRRVMHNVLRCKWPSVTSQSSRQVRTSNCTQYDSVAMTDEPAATNSNNIRRSLTSSAAMTSYCSRGATNDIIVESVQ